MDVWAWTGNPSSIPKRMWLTFTGSTRGAKPEQILVSDRPPAHWQHGAKFCVYIHLEEIHDYTTVAVDLDGNEACAPSKRRLPEWHLGVADGDPVPARAFENFPHHPPPPRTRQGREPERIDDRDDRRRRAKDDRDRSRPRRSYNDDHPDHDRDQAWRRRDDDDDRDGRGGRGREAWRGRESRKVSGLDGQRVRERSPRRRDWAEDDRRGDRRHHVQAAVALPATIPPLKLAPKQVTDFKMLFSLNSHPLQAPRENLRETGERLVNRVNNFAAAVDDASQPGGEEAWSDRRPSRVHDVPIRQVFDRLKHCLFPAGIHSTPSHSGQVMPHDERASIGAVEEALAALQLMADAGHAVGERTPPFPTSPLQCAGPSPVWAGLLPDLGLQTGGSCHAMGLMGHEDLQPALPMSTFTGLQAGHDTAHPSPPQGQQARTDTTATISEATLQTPRRLRRRR